VTTCWGADGVTALRSAPTDRERAESFRAALRELAGHVGWELPGCLAGETDDCGESDAMHTVVFLGFIQAVTDHILSHHADPGARFAAAQSRVEATTTLWDNCSRD
jgi:hypothetical protein